METLPGVAPPEQQNTYFYIGQHETKRTVPVTTELAEQAQDAGVSLLLCISPVLEHCQDVFILRETSGYSYCMLAV